MWYEARLLSDRRLIAAGAALLAALPATGWACRCTEPGPERALRAAQSVALGQIVSVDTGTPGKTHFTFSVERSWKQSLPAEITIEDSAVCPLGPVAGARYVLFLHQEKSGGFETAKCRGDVAEDKAQATLQILDSAKPK